MQTPCIKQVNEHVQQTLNHFLLVLFSLPDLTAQKVRLYISR